ncbi:MAG: helix-turn-helix domain-containing protein [Mogibacterium sp.]|nr:helix-turn-helix domain-containing protein [Mogibacterium sp.]
MIFRDIISRLESMCQIEKLSDSFEDEILEVQFIDFRQQEFSDNILYFSNNMQECSKLPRQCVFSESVAKGRFDLDNGNYAIVSESDFGYAFNTAFQLVIGSHKDDYYESMMSTLDRVKDVDTLIDIGSQTFGASLVFIDRDFRILSYSTQIPVTDDLWKKNIERGYCDYEFIQTVKSLKSVQMADSTMNPIEVSCSSSPFQKFSSRVYCHDTWIGFLIVIEGYDSYRPEHVEMLRILSGVVGYAVMKYAPSYMYMTSDYHRFLYNLIIGAEPASLPEAYTHLTFPSELQVLYCKATRNGSQFPREGELSEALTMVMPGCHVISQRDNAAIIGSSEMLNKIGSIAALFPDKCRVKIGVSLPFSNIETLRAHFREAIDAFETGEMLDADIGIYTFEDYGIYVMFRTVSDSEDLSRYLHPAIPKLADYDKANNANLELTLHTYLKHACNTTETADALYLHRNSVIYRLRRIEELCDIDLTDTDTRFRLRLSYAISNVINQKRKWAGKQFGSLG